MPRKNSKSTPKKEKSNSSSDESDESNKNNETQAIESEEGRNLNSSAGQFKIKFKINNKKQEDTEQPPVNANALPYTNTSPTTIITPDSPSTAQNSNPSYNPGRLSIKINLKGGSGNNITATFPKDANAPPEEIYTDESEVQEESVDEESKRRKSTHERKTKAVKKSNPKLTASLRSRSTQPVQPSQQPVNPTTTRQQSKKKGMVSRRSTDVNKKLIRNDSSRTPKGKAAAVRKRGSHTSPINSPQEEDNMEVDDPESVISESNFIESDETSRGRVKTRASNRKKKNVKKSNNTTNTEPEEENKSDAFALSTNFWKTIAEYMAPLDKEDVNFCTIDKDRIPENSTHMQIPELGKHFKEVWYQEDQDQMDRSVKVEDNENGYSEGDHKFGAGSSGASAGTSGVDEFGNLQIHCGDLTSRILSALVQERHVNSTFLSTSLSNPAAFTNPQPLNQSSSNINKMDTTWSKSIISGLGYGKEGEGETPSRYQTIMQEIDDRIKSELRNLGLLDGNYVGGGGTSNQKIKNEDQDDEICIELKKLQEKLQEQVYLNRQRRSSYCKLVQQKIEEQRRDQSLKELYLKQEEEYIKKLMLSKKRKQRLSQASQSGTPAKKIKNEKSV